MNAVGANLFSVTQYSLKFKHENYTPPNREADMGRDKSEAREESSVLRKKKVMRLEELQSVLQCSRRTAQRRLADWNAIRSCNRNGGCYTLPDIPTFDANGLWRYRGRFLFQIRQSARDVRSSGGSVPNRVHRRGSRRAFRTPARFFSLVAARTSGAEATAVQGGGVTCMCRPIRPVTRRKDSSEI
jgi:hypothetical protein